MTSVKRLTDQQVRSAAEMLLEARAGRLALGCLPAEVTPEDTADVQRIINLVSEGVGRPVLGWKFYCLYKPTQIPFYAPVYDVFQSGATIPVWASPDRLPEPEIMFRIERDFPARDRNYEIAEIMEAATCVVAFEAIGRRLRKDVPPGSDMPQVKGDPSLLGHLCDHISNGCIVIGDSVPGWRDVAFEDVQVRMTEDGAELVSVRGCHPIDNPFLPVVAAINRLRRHKGVKAGEIILTTSSTSFFPVRAGTEVRAVYEGLGEVTATFAQA